MKFYRTYFVTIRVPQGSVEDCLLYDSKEPIPLRPPSPPAMQKTTISSSAPATTKVGQETHKPSTSATYSELESWVRARFTQAGPVDYLENGPVRSSSLVDLHRLHRQEPGVSNRTSTSVTGRLPATDRKSPEIIGAVQRRRAGED
ncbi:MAG: hypothetical protein Q9219_005536 [cf. Caloplaca sp. 3 TL-2023]